MQCAFPQLGSAFSSGNILSGEQAISSEFTNLEKWASQNFLEVFLLANFVDDVLTTIKVLSLNLLATYSRRNKLRWAYGNDWSILLCDHTERLIRRVN